MSISIKSLAVVLICTATAPVFVSQARADDQVDRQGQERPVVRFGDQSPDPTYWQRVQQERKQELKDAERRAEQRNEERRRQERIEKERQDARLHSCCARRTPVTAAEAEERRKAERIEEQRRLELLSEKAYQERRKLLEQLAEARKNGQATDAALQRECDLILEDRTGARPGGIEACHMLYARQHPNEPPADPEILKRQQERIDSEREEDRRQTEKRMRQIEAKRLKERQQN